MSATAGSQTAAVYHIDRYEQCRRRTYAARRPTWAVARPPRNRARQWLRREVEAVIWDVLGRELPTLTLPQHLNVAIPRRGTPPHVVKLDEIARDLGVSVCHIRRRRFDGSEVVAWLGTVRSPPGNEDSLR